MGRPRQQMRGRQTRWGARSGCVRATHFFLRSADPRAGVALATALLGLLLGTAVPTPALAEQRSPTPTATPALPGTPPALTDADVVARVSPAVVQVVTSSGMASGVKITAGILTNAHVVSGEEEFEIVRTDGARRPATLLRSDPFYDLALLTTDLDLLALESQPARQHRPGDPVLVLGYPFARMLTGPPSVSRGVLSAIRELEGVVFVQTDAAMDVGSSGSAIVDLQGRLLGIAAGGLGETGAVNIGIATESVDAFLQGVALVEPDDAEPDDTMESAHPLELDGSPEARNLHVPGDVDWVLISVDADEQIALSATSSTCALELELYGADGTRIALGERSQGGGTRIEFEAAEGETYYGRVAHLSPGGVCRSYELTAERIGGRASDRSPR